jgi:hypothetical protein
MSRGEVERPMMGPWRHGSITGFMKNLEAGQVMMARRAAPRRRALPWCRATLRS